MKLGQVIPIEEFELPDDTNNLVLSAIQDVEQRRCKYCGSLKVIPREIKQLNSIFPFHVPCDCAGTKRQVKLNEREFKRLRTNRLLQQAGLQSAYFRDIFDKDWDMDRWNYDGWSGKLKRDVYHQLGELHKNPRLRVLAFVGVERGTGKTMMLLHALRRLTYMMQVQPMYIVWRDYLQKSLHDSKSSGYDYHAIQRLVKCPLLAIDDMDKGILSDAELDAAYTVIDERSKNHYPTLIAANVSAEEVNKRPSCLLDGNRKARSPYGELLLGSIESRLRIRMLRSVIDFTPPALKEKMKKETSLREAYGVPEAVF